MTSAYAAVGLWNFPTLIFAVRLGPGISHGPSMFTLPKFAIIADSQDHNTNFGIADRTDFFMLLFSIFHIFCKYDIFCSFLDNKVWTKLGEGVKGYLKYVQIDNFHMPLTNLSDTRFTSVVLHNSFCDSRTNSHRTTAHHKCLKSKSRHKNGKIITVGIYGVHLLKCWTRKNISF